MQFIINAVSPLGLRKRPAVGVGDNPQTVAHLHAWRELSWYELAHGMTLIMYGLDGSRHAYAVGLWGSPSRAFQLATERGTPTPEAPLRHALCEPLSNQAVIPPIPPNEKQTWRARAVHDPYWAVLMSMVRDVYHAGWYAAARHEDADAWDRATVTRFMEETLFNKDTEEQLDAMATMAAAGKLTS